MNRSHPNPAPSEAKARIVPEEGLSMIKLRTQLEQ
jgi:hypothetical protein